MDIAREGVIEARRKKQLIWGAIGAVVLAVATIGLMRLEPAAPTVDKATVYTDTVKRGEMLRQVRGPGTLVPEEIRWIAARTIGRVERKVILPGAEVLPETVIVELSNPELEQQTMDAELGLRAGEARLVDLQVTTESRFLNERAQAAALESEFIQAQLQLEADNKLAEEGLIPELTAKLSKVRAEQLRRRHDLEQERLRVSERAYAAQVLAERARLEQARNIYVLRRSELDGLRVRAGIHGVLQQVPLEVGQQVAPGTNLARVAQPEKLKAELRINETQAKDVGLGQLALVDTRNGIVEGRVMRIDPAVQNGTVTVDVQLVGALPQGARPDLSVDGTIEIERLPDVLYVGRPAYGQSGSTIGLFKLAVDGSTAARVPVQLGKMSVTTVEIQGGLAVNDVVILSDMSNWDEFDKVRLN